MMSRRVLAVAVTLSALLVATVGVTAASSQPVAGTPVVTAASHRTGDPGSSPAYRATLARYGTQRLRWKPCYDDDYPGFECTHMSAPMDWGHPSRGDIRILVTRILASGKRHGILQTNPGGPGGSGFFLPVYLRDSEPEVARHFDLIGMDPRGVGGSTELKCHGTGALQKLYDLDGRDHAPSNTLEFLRLSKREADGCAGDVLTPFITTDQTVRDIDLVRVLFGEQKTSWLGYSAGTWMGAWYATQFPSHADRFVLDGNFDFTSTWDEASRPQAQAFQRRFDADLLPWLARHDDVFHLGASATEVDRTYEHRRAALARHPLGLLDGSELSASGYDEAIIGALYSSSEFPYLGTALSVIERFESATRADQKLATDELATAPVDQSEHVLWSIVCNDTTTPPQSQVFADWLTIGSRYPLTGSSWLAYPCSYWRVPPTGSPVTGRGIPPLLMIQNDGDPATPYAGGLRAHQHTPGSVLLTVRNEGSHTIYAAGDRCVDRAANDWLVRGRLPSTDAVCPGLPIPEPNSVDPASSDRRAAPIDATRTTLTVRTWGERFLAAHPTPS